jgi:peptide/nickel transport system substrate-binding protein
VDGVDRDRVSRRQFLALLGLGAGGTRLAASPPGTSAPTPARELVVATWDEPISLDPANTAAAGLNPARLIFDTLVVQGTDSTLHPGVAESWQVSRDGHAYTFRLRRNVRFHDGTVLDARAVQYSLDRANGPQAKANFTISLAGIYQSAQIVDELTVRVVLSRPYAAFLPGLAEAYYSIVSPAAVEKDGSDFDRNPVGSGPFIFQEWVSKSHVTVRLNPAYASGSPSFTPQGPARLDGVTFRLVPDSSTRLATLETGEVHVALEIPPEELGRLRTDRRLRLLGRVAAGTSAQLMLNTSQPPLDDLRIRQAIEYAVNQDDLCRVLFRAALGPSRTLLAPGTLGFDDGLATLYRPDPGRARALLDAVGWVPARDGIRTRQGKRLEITISIVSAGIQTLPVKLAELVQAQLREVGILLNIQQVDTAALFAIMREGRQQIVLGWRAGPDPDVIRPLFHSSFFGKSPVARIRFRHDRLDELLVRGAQELDGATRQAIYQEIQQIVLTNALVVPLWNRHFFVGAQSRVRGLDVDTTGTLNLRDAWLA